MKKGYSRMKSLLNKETTRRLFLKGIGIGSLSLGMKGLSVSSTSAAAQKRFMFCGPDEINTMDPAGHMDAGRVVVRINFYDGLFRWRDNPPVLQPWLAVSYKASPDLLRWTFVLRKGAKFHDGSEVTSEDVVYSLERLLALKTGAASLFLPIIEPKSTRAVDRYTIEFNLKKPTAPFMSFTHFLHVLNKDVLQKHEKNGDWGSKWLGMTGSRLGPDGVGSGSFAVTMYKPAVGFDGVRFKDHFREWNHPHFEEIGFRTQHELSSRILGLMKGDFHGDTGYISYEQWTKAQESPLVQIVQKPSLRVFYYPMHNRKPPLNDVHFRRALCYAFDYEGWIKHILNDQVDRCIGPVPDPMWGSLDSKKEFGYAYDLDKAREELKKVKVDYKKYFPLEIASLIGYAMQTRGSEFLQACLRKIGVETKIISRTFPAVFELVRKEETTPHIIATYRSLYYADPHSFIGEMFDSDKWGSYSGGCWYKNPKVDELLRKALRTFAKEDREPLYKEAGRLVVADAPAIFVHNEKWTSIFNKDVRGIRHCPVGDAHEFRWLYWA